MYFHHHRRCLRVKILLIVCFVLQLFLVDLVDIGLMNANEAAGRRRLNETINKLSDVIQQGLAAIIGNTRFGVTSLRQCASGGGINNGCSDGTVLATGSPSPPNGGIGAPSSIMCWLFAIVAFLLYYT